MENNNQILLNLLEKEEIQEKIVSLYCELDKNRFAEGGMSGWSYKIVLDIDGDVDYMYVSNNTTRQDVHEGKAIIVATLDSVVEVSTDSLGDVEDVEDIEEFKKSIINDYELFILENDLEDTELRRIEFTEDKLNWMEYYEFNAEGFQKAELEAWENICDYHSSDTANDKIYDTIQSLQLESSY